MLEGRKNIYIKTFGCQMNVYDSERVENFFLKNGFEIVDDILKADIIFLNTCCVRNSAEERAYGEIGNFKKLKEKNENLIIVVAGCIPAKEGENLKKRFPHIDLILRPDEIDNFEKIISLSQRENIVSKKSKSIVSSFVKVIEGCNCSCTFCIVPYVRGKERSRSLKEIINEIKTLSEKNCKEVILIGQNIAAYGSDLKEEKVNLSSLLKEVHKIPGIERIKFITSHPLWIKEELINTVAELPKVCEYFHLPIQAGDDEILKRMRRGYTVSYYENLVEKIRKIIKDAVITTDIIVGFPGEKEENFKNTLKFLERIEFDSVFTFMFSPREHTPAKDFSEQIPLELKKERLLIINELVKKIAYKKNKSYENKIVEVLPEEKIENKLISRTRGNKIVEFEGNENLIGKLVNVRIEKIQTWKLYGKLV
jgi:tRNA-2-methylthio-N6-dimethylallyladenosine synthase